MAIGASSLMDDLAIPFEAEPRQPIVGERRPRTLGDEDDHQHDCDGDSKIEQRRGRKNHRVLRAQVQDLSTAVTVMMRMLAESGALDATVLKYRVEAELEAIADARANPAAQTVQCITCGQVGPAARTVLTGDGTVCDVCAAGVR